MAYNIELKIKINDQWVDKSEYIQLPVSITETMDDTLDRAELKLNFTNDATEYEAYSPVKIRLYNDEGYSKQYDMIIQNDKMEEKIIGRNSSYYSHSITLIEATQRLTSYIVNDFSVTQPVVVGNPDIVPPGSIPNSVVSAPVKSPSVDKKGFWNNIGYDWTTALILSYYGRYGETDVDAFRNGNYLQTADSFRTNGMGLMHNEFVSTGIDGTDLYYTSGAYDFNIDNQLYDIKREYDNADGFISIPKASGTFKLRTSSVKFAPKFIFLWDKYIVYEDLFTALPSIALPIRFVEKLYDVTNPGTVLDVSSLLVEVGDTYRIDKQLLDVGKKYRYEVRTAIESIDTYAWWDTDIIRQPYIWNSKLTINFGNYEPATVGEIVQSNDFQYMNSDTVITQFYYDFEIVEQVQPITVYTMADVLRKAVRNAESLKLYDTRIYVDESATYTGTNYESRIMSTITRVTNPSSSTSLGSATQYDYNKRFRLELAGTPSVFRIWRVASTLETTTPDTTIYDLIDSPVFYRDKKTLYIDQNIINKLEKIQAYDFSFTGNKNLLEILFEIGRVFDGIPRITYDNNDNYLISYDLLEDLEDNPLFIGETEDITVSAESNTDNYSTGLVSLVENAMIDGQGNKQAALIKYPSSNGWIRARSENGTGIVQLSNMAVVIEDENHGIYQIDKIYVRGVNAEYGYTSSGINIGNFIAEKTEYDATAKTLNGQGSLLYYDRGSNKILGLNEIDDLETIWCENFSDLGFDTKVLCTQQTRYRVENILRRLNVIPDLANYPIIDYEYQIHYIPIIKSNKITYEQSNISTENETVYTIYSQDERNVSLTQLGLTADRIMRRSGVNSINKVYIIDDPSLLPFIGEKITYEGYKYFADNITVTIDNAIIGINMSYSRDFNKIDRFVGFGKDFRQFEILQEDTIWKRININNYVLVDDNIYPDNRMEINKFNTFSYPLINFLTTSKATNVSRLESAIYRFYTLDGKKVKYILDPNEGQIQTETDDIIVPVISSTSNTSLIFTSSMVTNVSAGLYLIDIPGPDGINRYQERDARYVDSYGNAAIARVLYQNVGGTVIDGKQFPRFTGDYNTNINTAEADELIYIDKDNKEAIQISHILHYQSRNKDIEIRPGLVKWNQLVNNLSYSTAENGIDPGRLVPVLIEDIDSLKNIEKLDSFTSAGPAPGYNRSTSSLTATLSAHTIYPDGTFEGLAYVFQNTGDIAIVVKKNISGNGSPQTMLPIYFNFRNNL